MKPDLDITVSVVVPAGNARETIEEAVRSALDQTIAVKEVLIGLDGCTDGTEEVLQRLAKTDPRVRWIRSSRRMGPSATRNALIESATGEWIGLLDADDAWRANRLESLVHLLPGADAVSDDVRFWIEGVREGSTLCMQNGFQKPATVFLSESDFVKHDLGWLKPLLRKDFLRQAGLSYRTEVVHSEDFDLYIRSLRAGSRWAHHPTDGYLYRKHSGSLSRRWREGLEQSIAVCRDLRDRAPESATFALLDDRIREKRAIMRCYEIREHFQDGRLAALMGLVAKPSTFAAAWNLARIRLARRFT